VPVAWESIPTDMWTHVHLRTLTAIYGPVAMMCSVVGAGLADWGTERHRRRLSQTDGAEPGRLRGQLMEVLLWDMELTEAHIVSVARLDKDTDALPSLYPVSAAESLGTTGVSVCFLHSGGQVGEVYRTDSFTRNWVELASARTRESATAVEAASISANAVGAIVDEMADELTKRYLWGDEPTNGRRWLRRYA